MASVRMTNDLRKIINDQAGNVFDGAVARAEKQIDPMLNDRLAMEYWNVVLKDYTDKLPNPWMCQVERLTCEVKYIDIQGAIEEYNIYTERLMKPLAVPKIIDLVEEDDRGWTLSIPDNFMFSETIVDEVTKWQNKINKVFAEQLAFEKNIKNILERCNTLKQFFDLWPQGENLVTASIMSDYNKANVVKKKDPIITEEVAQELSTSLLKQTLINK
jgi:hypothetical protein